METVRREELSIDPAGWLRGVRRVVSPNQDQRPSGEVSLLVVHGISLPPGRFGGAEIEALFSNRLDASGDPYFRQLQDLRVSAHLLIRRQGELVQFVSFLRRAWHAGQSQYLGRERCNDYSVGIELEGTDDLAYTDAQYLHLNRVIRTLQGRFPLLGQRHIVGHADIAPGRKTDPGAAFDWKRIETKNQWG